MRLEQAVFCSILDPRSSILNPQSSILDPRSSIFNPQSSILIARGPVAVTGAGVGDRPRRRIRGLRLFRKSTAEIVDCFGDDQPQHEDRGSAARKYDLPARSTPRRGRAEPGYDFGVTGARFGPQCRRSRAARCATARGLMPVQGDRAAREREVERDYYQGMHRSGLAENYGRRHPTNPHPSPPPGRGREKLFSPERGREKLFPLPLRGRGLG